MPCKSTIFPKHRGYVKISHANQHLTGFFPAFPVENVGGRIGNYKVKVLFKCRLNLQ